MRRSPYLKKPLSSDVDSGFCYSIIGVYCFYIQHRIPFFVNEKLLKSMKISINYSINQMKESNVRQK